MVAQLKDQNRNGNIVHALRSDENAKEWLDRVGVGELRFTRIHNTPCTLLNLAAKWMGAAHLHQKLEREALKVKPFGIYVLHDVAEAEKVLSGLGLWSLVYERWVPTKGVHFLSYRVLLILTLTARSDRGALLRKEMGLPNLPRFNVKQILEMGGATSKSAPIEPAVIVPKVEPARISVVSLPSLPKEGDNPDEVLKELCSFLAEADGLKMLANKAKDRVAGIDRQIKELHQQIAELNQERSIYADTIDRLSKLF